MLSWELRPRPRPGSSGLETETETETWTKWTRVHSSLEITTLLGINDSNNIREHPHDKPRSYLCIVCHKQYRSRESLNIHSKRYKAENEYSCNQCDKRFFHLRVACKIICIFMQVNTSVQSAACVITLVITYQDTDEVIQERNRLNLLFVTNDLQHQLSLLCTVEFTMERNRTNVTCVRKHLVVLILCTDTWQSTWEINRLTVLTVGSSLRQTVIWSFMFVFTLVQSRTHVDTVDSVLPGLNNSRDICWSHTMKVLGWRVKFVRRNSATVVTLSSIYFDTKLWSLMYVVSVQSVSVQIGGASCRERV